MVVATQIEMGDTKSWICFQPFYACSYHVLIGFVKVPEVVCTHPKSATLDWLWTKLSLVWVCECELMMWLHVEGRVSRLYSCLLLDVHTGWLIKMCYMLKRSSWSHVGQESWTLTLFSQYFWHQVDCVCATSESVLHCKDFLSGY